MTARADKWIYLVYKGLRLQIGCYYQKQSGKEFHGCKDGNDLKIFSI
jgi:hypothetical protein